MRPRELSLTERSAQTWNGAVTTTTARTARTRRSVVKIAAGESVRAVALRRLLRPRTPETVYDELNRYQREGVSGLARRPRGHRGFSPQQQRRPRAGRRPDARTFWGAAGARAARGSA